MLTLKDLPVNLDAMDYDELRSVHQELKALANQVDTLSKYAGAKATGMSFRKDGKIEIAQNIETHCNVLFSCLPPELKW